MKLSTIVIPLHERGGKFHDNRELRYALRSLNKHFKDNFKVEIICEKLPSWIHGVTHVKAKLNLKQALKLAAERNPNGFFWFFDDCLILKDLTEQEMKKTPCYSFGRTPNSPWGKMLLEIKQKLILNNIKPWNYSSPHGPYWFDLDMIEDGFNSLGKMSNKKPIETWILSKADWPRRMNCTFVPREIMAANQVLIAEGDRDFYYAHYHDSLLTENFLDYLNNRFERASRFEKDKNKETSGIPDSAMKARDTMKIECEKIKKEIRTACEVGVGLNSELANIKADNKIFIEPNSSLLAAAEKSYSGKFINASIYERRVSGFFLDNDGKKFIINKEEIKTSEKIKSKQERLDKKRVGNKMYTKCFPFAVFDDEKIDVLSINVFGCEMIVLEQLLSRPMLIQTTKTERTQDIELWMSENGYKQIKKENEKFIYIKTQQ